MFSAAGSIRADGDPQKGTVTKPWGVAASNRQSPQYPCSKTVDGEITKRKYGCQPMWTSNDSNGYKLIMYVSGMIITCDKKVQVAH